MSGEVEDLAEVFDRLSVPTFIRDALTEAIDAERDRAVREALRESGFDNADLARQLTHACERRQAAFDEGYDKAMSDAHVSLGRFGYLQRLGESNGNPYRARVIPPAEDDPTTP